MSDTDKEKFVYIVVWNHGGSDRSPVNIVSVYDSENLAEKKCIERNIYEGTNYGDRSDINYFVQKYKLN